MRAAANSQTFDFYPLRYRFAASTLRDFSVNTLRGQLGSVLKKVNADAYSRFFAPRAVSGPSGLADPPRAFVIRVLGPLEVGLNLFVTREPAIELFTQVMTELGTLSSVSGTERLCLPLCVPNQTVHQLRVRFLTPTEIKGAGHRFQGFWGAGKLCVHDALRVGASRRRASQPLNGPTAFAGGLHRIR
jgi:hypothetical protein